MDIRPITEQFAVAPQIASSDMAALAEQGFAAIICNRPDGEEPGQPEIATLRAEAEAAGLAFHHIPVSGGAFPAAAVAAFDAVRKGTEGRVLGFCRTGTRSITLDALANPEGRSVEDRLSTATAAGYDLAGIADRLKR